MTEVAGVCPASRSRGKPADWSRRTGSAFGSVRLFRFKQPETARTVNEPAQIRYSNGEGFTEKMTCLTSVVVIMCAVGTVTSSLESRILTFVDGAIRRAETIELAEGVRLVNTSAESPRTLQGDFGTLLADRVRSFFQNHAIRVDLSGTDVRSGVRAISDFAEAVVEPRGKKNKMKKMKKTKDYILPLLLGMKAKMALLSAMMGNMIAIIAGKALLLGKIALILGAMLFLKKLAVSPPKDVVYYKHKKVVPTAHDKLDWGGRTDSFPQPPIAAAQEMAYAGQKQTPQS